MRVLYENLSLLTASYSRGRLIVEGVFYSRKYGMQYSKITVKYAVIIKERKSKIELNIQN